MLLATQMAVESDWVYVETVEANEFPDLSEQVGVSGVPHTSIDFGAGEMVGAGPEAMLVEEIRQTLLRELSSSGETGPQEN